MNVDELIDKLEKMPNRNIHLDADQETVIKHGVGPLWVIAGPGSGKTDSIVLRCIKLLVVDKVQPASIILTTFTEKAANNLQNRISQYMMYLSTIDEYVKHIDYNRVRIDTLHGLCNDIMQEFRFTGYQNYRLLDEVEQRLFIMEHSSAASLDKGISQSFDKIWNDFPYVFNAFDPLSKSKWTPGSGRSPNRHIKARGLGTLFNRIIEDMVDVDKIKKAGNGWEALIRAYEEYKDKLFSNYRCDFAHVQAKFLDFLNSEQARLFLIGNGSDEYPGVKHVLVDEYQDTNPVQEEIYFKLANETKNLCVVGDDDQALYRFRGGTVECMINFENTCHIKWPMSSVDKIFLSTNYRSNPGIISFYDGFIRSFNEMNVPGARVQSKPSLKAGSTIQGDYPPVAIHRGHNRDDVAEFFADVVKGLKDTQIIGDLSECVLLLPSTKRSKRNAGAFMDAMDKLKIPYYNPRSRSLLEEEKIQAVLGGLLEIIDPRSSAQGAVRFPGIREISANWRKQFDSIANTNPNLREYVGRYAESILRMGPTTPVGVNLLEIFYDLLNYPPLSAWIDDPEISDKLGVVCTVLDAYSNVPSSKNTTTMLGFLYTSSTANGGISFNWRKNFYYSLLGLLASEGLNEAEDEIENFPRGRVPIMTIHQSKGLEFPLVFVYGLSKDNGNDSTALLEAAFSRFRRNIPAISGSLSTQQKNKQDLIRLFFVAYSRAQYALILLAKQSEYSKPGVGFGGNSNWSAFGNSVEI